MRANTQKIPNQPLHASHCHSNVITLDRNFLERGPGGKIQNMHLRPSWVVKHARISLPITH